MLNKSFFLLVIFLIIHHTLVAQNIFDSGYYIKNNDQKIDCLIKNYDWENSPSFIYVKSSNAEKEEIIHVDDIKEFRITDKKKYIKKYVQIDRSSEDLERLSKSRNVNFKSEEIMLEVLVEGKISLFYYQEEQLRRFFIGQGTESLEQLVSKTYRLSNNRIAHNTYFKQQLLLLMPCENLKKERFENLSYYKKDLFKLFKDYNSCAGLEATYFNKNHDKKTTYIGISAGINRSSLSINGENANGIPIDIQETKISYNAGFDIDVVIPNFNRLWSITIQPHLHIMKMRTSNDYTNQLNVMNSLDVNIDYSEFNLSFGIKRKFYWNDKNEVFINSAVQFSFPLNRSIQFEDQFELDLEPSFTPLFGFGVMHKEKYRFEVRGYLQKNILVPYKFISSSLSYPSLIIGYQFN